MNLFSRKNKDLQFEEFITSEIEKNEDNENRKFDESVEQFITRHNLTTYEILENNNIEKLKIKCALLRRARRYLDDEYYLEVIDHFLDLYRQLLSTHEDKVDLDHRQENRKTGNLKDLTPPHPDMVELTAKMEMISDKMKSGEISPHEAESMIDNVEKKLAELSQNAL